MSGFIKTHSNFWTQSRTYSRQWGQVVSFVFQGPSTGGQQSYVSIGWCGENILSYWLQIKGKGLRPQSSQCAKTAGPWVPLVLWRHDVTSNLSWTSSVELSPTNFHKLGEQRWRWPLCWCLAIHLSSPNSEYQPVDAKAWWINVYKSFEHCKVTITNSSLYSSNLFNFIKLSVVSFIPPSRSIWRDWRFFFCFTNVDFHVESRSMMSSASTLPKKTSIQRW